MSIQRWTSAAWLLLSFALPAVSAAHVGPPFPIIEGKRAGPYLTQVWTDPDIGIGTFFVIVEPQEAGAGRPTRVSVSVQPVTGRLDRVDYQAMVEPSDIGTRYGTEVAFDRGGWWRVWVTIAWEGGEAVLTSEVEATPDGQVGPIGLALFAIPFLLVGLLWLKVFRRRRAIRAAPAPRQTPRAPSRTQSDERS